jgi:hypothetical protein
MMMGPVQDGLQFQSHDVIDFAMTSRITFNFSLKVIFNFWCRRLKL